MKKIVAIIITALFSIQLFAKGNDLNDCKGLALFLNFENKIDSARNRSKIDNKFLSPVDEAIIFEKILRKESPLLMDSTRFYSKHLIELLFDSSIQKSSEFNLDIVRILYHLCINDYILAVNEIYKGYCDKRVSIDVFLNCIITYNGHYSNIVAVNYNSATIQLLLNSISKNNTLINQAQKKYSNFIKIIEDLRNGVLSKAFENEEKDWFFAITPHNCL